MLNGMITTLYMINKPMTKSHFIFNGLEGCITSLLELTFVRASLSLPFNFRAAANDTSASDWEVFDDEGCALFTVFRTLLKKLSVVLLSGTLLSLGAPLDEEEEEFRDCAA